MANILLNELDRNRHRKLRAALENHGYRVWSVVDLTEIAPTLAKVAIDVLVLDLDGQDLDRIGELAGGWRGKPLLLQTSHPEQALDFRSWIADEFIYEGDNGHKMVKAVSMLLGPERRN